MTQGRFFIVSIKVFSSANFIFFSLKDNRVSAHVASYSAHAGGRLHADYGIIPCCWITEEFSACPLTVFDVLQNSTEFPQEFVVGKLLFCCFIPQHLQVFNHCKDFLFKTIEFVMKLTMILDGIPTYLISLLLFKCLFYSVGPVIKRFRPNL